MGGPVAILPDVVNIHREPTESPPILPDHLYQHSVSDNNLVFTTPAMEGVAPVQVFQSCIQGSCKCVHMIGNEPAQLKPCRSACFLFGDSRLDNIDDDESLFLWKGLTNGFAIVDDDCQASYNCQNYDSILDPKACSEMTALLEQEVLENKVTIVRESPKCIHSLGAVWKSNGKLRPITDCSRPDGSSINNYMSTTFTAFSYNSIQDAVDLLAPGDYMAVVDIASAYRSVNVRGDQVCFQGLVWDFGDGPIMLQDNRLCFGLRCAPNIFDCLSRFVVLIAQSWGASRIVNYLDDFLVISDSPESCLYQRGVVTSVLEHLGFQVPRYLGKK